MHHPIGSRRTPVDAPAAAVLLAEDDPGSCHFLTSALRALGCTVISCGDGPRALTLAQLRHVDLLLLDCHMPHGGALFVVDRLRQLDPAFPTHTPIVATSAEVAPELRRTLLDAGCTAVMEKPLPVHALCNVLKAVLPATHANAVLDDAQALGSTGNETVMRQLRALLADELRVFLHDLDTLMATPAALGERLHKLRAACGFCGASNLADEALRVKFLIDQEHAPSRELSTRLRAAATTTLHALEQRTGQITAS